MLFGFGITIILTYLIIFIFPDVSSIHIWFLWLVFMLLQKKQVKKWSEENQDKKYKSWFKALGWGILWWGLFYITIFITIMYFSVSTVINEDHISISKQYPREVMLNDSFDIEFSITNIDKVDHKLNSIDIDNDLLEGILIKKINPSIVTEYDNFWMRVFEFKNDLNMQAENKIIFSAKAIKKWDFSWDVDFCIDSDVSCIYNGMRILVK